MELRLLGPIEVRVGGRPLRLNRRQHRLILGILGLAGDRPVPATRMINLLWAGRPPARAQAVLHSRISELRAAARAVADDPITSTRDGYRLRISPANVDVYRFQRLLAEARHAGSDRRLREALRQALALWRGQPLGGWLPGPSHHALCRGLESARLTAAEDLYEAELRLGEHDVIVDGLVDLSAAHPGRDRLTQALMLALHRSGRTAEAIEAYQRNRRWLRTELGIDPGQRLQQLHVALLRGDPGLAAATSHRPWLPPRQLPPAIRHFAGRATELAVLTRLAESTRFAGDGQIAGSITIAVVEGPAGIGKTALAVQWAHSVAAWFPDGQLYLDLRGSSAGGPPTSPASALRLLLDGLGAPAQLAPADPESLVGRVRSLLARKRMLLVLDDARDADQVRPLLPAAATCLVLVTSRDRLESLVSREGARLLRLEPLSPEEARLLLIRWLGAHRVASEPAATDELIAQAAGLPLALVTLAARTAGSTG